MTPRHLFENRSGSIDERERPHNELDRGFTSGARGESKMTNQSFSEAFSPRSSDADGFSEPLPAGAQDDTTSFALDQQLEKTISSEIIPRMMLVLKATAASEQVPGAPIKNQTPSLRPTQTHIEELAHLLMMPSADTSRRYVEQLHLQGMSMDAIYLQLLAPTASHFGELWEQDTRDFTEVTTALSRLHAIVRRLGPSFRANEKLNDHSKSAEWSGSVASNKKALICPMPGEQHTFGCVIVEDFFKRGGWDVNGWPPSSESDLLETVRHSHFDLVGLSVSCSSSLGRVERLIKDIRRHSTNRSILVLAGGHAFAGNPQQAIDLGADATGSNGHDALLAADNAIAKLTERLLP
jgi:MerR family transcriptional regulator, light-induced transcriptional regulator